MTCDQCGSLCEGKYCRDCSREEHQKSCGKTYDYGWAIEADDEEGDE